MRQEGLSDVEDCFYARSLEVSFQIPVEIESFKMGSLRKWISWAENWLRGWGAMRLQIKMQKIIGDDIGEINDDYSDIGDDWVVSLKFKSVIGV